MKITLAEKNRNNKMVRIYIDDSYSFTIPVEDYIRNNLYEEVEIDEQKLEEIRNKVLVQAARERGVRFLTFKDRSVNELFKKLMEVGFDEEVANKATEYLTTIGYLDDNRYAMRYLSERIRTKALSKRSLEYELKNKGIADELINKAMSEFEIDDYQVALREAKRKFGKYNMQDKKVEQRACRFLLHRGFSYELVNKVMKEMKDS